MNLVNSLAKAVGWCIARVRINRLSHETIGEHSFIRKQRNLTSWILIALGNFVFRFRKVPVRVLHQREWLQWEQAIHKAMGLAIPTPISRGLLLPEISGTSLLYAVDSRVHLLSGDDVVASLSLALEALYRLHQIEIVVDGKPVLVSHGDASITNVMIGEDAKSATWLDFDLRHDLRQPASLRHADDLRAFMHTAVRCLAVEEYSDELMDRFMRAMKLAYPEEEIWRLYSMHPDGVLNAIDVFSCAQNFRSRLAQWN